MLLRSFGGMTIVNKFEWEHLGKRKSSLHLYMYVRRATRLSSLSMPVNELPHGYPDHLPDREEAGKSAAQDVPLYRPSSGACGEVLGEIPDMKNSDVH